MKSGHGVLFVLICVGLVSSCGGQSGDRSGVESVHFWDVMCPKLSYNALSSEAVNTIINSEDEFEAAWAELNYDGPHELPPIDFSKGSLVMVYGGLRGTNNEWVNITDIELSTDNQIRVRYNDFTASHPGCGGDAVISYPFCIVQVDANALKADFHHDELNSCDVTDKPDLE